MHVQIIFPAQITKENRDRFPYAKQAADGDIPLDRKGGTWIGATECQEIEPLPEGVRVTLDLNQEMQALRAAYNRGERLCYDGDTKASFPDEDGYGGIEAEIFWAVTYRGGLSICK